MSPLALGILGCLLMLLLLAGSMPVAFAMLLVGGLGFALLRTPDAAINMMLADLFTAFSNPSLTVIPLFVFMGQIAFHAGISRRLFRAAHCWLGAFPGGLAMATIGACTAFGAICGSGPATAATMATVALPEMKRFGYSMELGTGAVAAGGSLGMLIPPSVVFIVYGIMAEQSIGALFLAGIIPGLLIAVLFCATIIIQCWRRPELAPPVQSSSWRQRAQTLLQSGETLLLFILVIGGMFIGWFTPTEAAAIGAAGSLAVAVVRRQLSFRNFLNSLRETLRTSCMVMSIVAGAVVFGRFLTLTRIPLTLAGWLSDLPLPPAMIVAGIIVFFLFGGCFVDALALILLTIPIFLPVIDRLGFNPIWFGVIVVLVTQMGVISPPVGINVYVVSGLERDVPLQVIFRGAMPFLLALLVAAVILVAFPQLSLALPQLMAR